MTLPTSQPVCLTATRPLGVSPSATARTGIVLIGTGSTVRSLQAQLASIEPSPIPAGCVIVDEAGLAPDGVPRIDDLIAHHARRPLSLALVCLPDTLRDEKTRIFAQLRQIAVEWRELPALADVLAPTDRQPPLPIHRPLDLDALIGREPHRLDPVAVGAMVRGANVLITGAGGSIGSELARVAARFEPSRIVLMDRSENALFEIDRQLARRHPDVPRETVLHDIVDPGSTGRLLGRIRPDIVFHAAAHKHVPLMEDHPAHALRNNLFGTKSIVDASIRCGVGRFVMISTDKAVNPTSVMGATKRMGELYVRAVASSAPETAVGMVRFGNVLGSACSVLTIWAAQLAEGGPLTITDPRMTRFFMTIPEAATLVVQAATMSTRGDDPRVFVLDMDQPLRIVDLAVRFLAAHGADARFDPRSGLASPSTGLPRIDVAFTGVRPGEKLHEELVYELEQLHPTLHPGVRVVDEPGGSSAEGVRRMMVDLDRIALETDRAGVLEAIRRYVPQSTPALTGEAGEAA